MPVHKAEPFAIAEEGDNSVDGVEDSIEGYAFIPIETGADGIDQDPDYPLLEIFTGKHPHAYYAQGGGEGIGDGDCAVGKIVEDQI